MTEHEPDSLAKSASIRFDCPKCGGQRIFDAERSLLRCESCGQTDSVKSRESHAIVEYDLEKGLSETPMRGFGLELKSCSCRSCGAIISFGLNEVATACSFCGSSNVLERASHRQTLRPESLVPFQRSKADASQYFQKWISSLWLRPNNLKKLAKVSLLQGVYIPYWVFDATIDSQWSAMAGYYYYVTESYTATVNGKSTVQTRQVQKTRWSPASGSRHDIYDDVLICASKGLPPKLVSKLDSFNTTHLKPYDPSYLAGWKAEEYQLDLKPAWAQAVHLLEQSQESRCSSDVPGDTQMGLQVENQFSETRFKHVLLPIWIAAYRYNDKVYQFLVNGQTGEVEGDAPYSYWKIGFLILFIVIFCLIALLVYGSASSQTSAPY